MFQCWLNIVAFISLGKFWKQQEKRSKTPPTSVITSTAFSISFFFPRRILIKTETSVLWTQTHWWFAWFSYFNRLLRTAHRPKAENPDFANKNGETLRTFLVCYLRQPELHRLVFLQTPQKRQAHKNMLFQCVYFLRIKLEPSFITVKPQTQEKPDTIALWKRKEKAPTSFSALYCFYMEPS